jgi:hypothetical protein
MEWLFLMRHKATTFFHSASKKDLTYRVVSDAEVIVSAACGGEKEINVAVTEEVRHVGDAVAVDSAFSCGAFFIPGVVAEILIRQVNAGCR